MILQKYLIIFPQKGPPQQLLHNSACKAYHKLTLVSLKYNTIKTNLHLAKKKKKKPVKTATCNAYHKLDTSQPKKNTHTHTYIQKVEKIVKSLVTELTPPYTQST